MATVVQQITFVQGGRLVRRRTYWDELTGTQWDDYEDAGKAPENAQEGAVVAAEAPPSPSATGPGPDGESPPPAAGPGARAEGGGDPRSGGEAGTPSDWLPPGYQVRFPNMAPWTGGLGSLVPPPQAPQSPPTVYQGFSTPYGAAPPGGAGFGGGNDMGWVTQPQTSPGGPAGLPSTPGQPLGPNPQVDTQAMFRNQLLYGPDQPETALTNVLLDRGFNPLNPGRPYDQWLLNFAPALALAYYAQGASQGGTLEDIAQAAGGFKDFLTGNLGNLGGAALGTLRNLPAILAMARQAAQPGQDLLSVNPFAAALLNILGAQMGQGTVGALRALVSPFLPRGMGRAYESALERAYLGGLRRAANTPGFYEPEGPDIWNFLLGF